MKPTGFASLLAVAQLCVFGLGCPQALAPDQTPAPTTADLAAIHPGDVVRLRIWREPDLSGDFAVDEAGAVVLPRLGALNIAADSVASLRAKIVSAYERILSHSSIEVTVLRRLQVLGAVRNPGLYPVDPTMTVEDGLALAGGVTPEGNPNRIELRRHGLKLPVRLDQRMAINASPVRSGDQLYVPERSWLSRNTGTVVGILSVAATTVVLLVRR